MFNNSQFFQDFTVQEKIKKDYIKAWQKSKIEMNEIVCQMKEEEKLEKIKMVNLNVGREMRVHEEIILAYQEFQEVLLKITENKV